MMLTILMEGITLGLAAGIFCLPSCAMVYIPLLLSQKNGIIASTWIMGEFILGRLAAYLLFGALAGCLGLEWENPFTRKIAATAMILLSGLLLLYVINQVPLSFKFCPKLPGFTSKIPIVLGFITGINVCPPFLLAVTRAVDTGSMLQGMELFFGFFLGTSIYLLMPLPLGFLGKWENVRIVAYMTAVLSSIFFMVFGIGRLLN